MVGVLIAVVAVNAKMAICVLNVSQMKASTALLVTYALPCMRKKNVLNVSCVSNAATVNVKTARCACSVPKMMVSIVLLVEDVLNPAKW